MLDRSPLREVLEDDPSGTSSSGTSASNYLGANYGGRSNYLGANYGSTNSDTLPVEEEQTTNYFSSERNYPSDSHEPQEKTSPTNYLSERNYPGGSHGAHEQGSVSEPQDQGTENNYLSRNYGGNTSDPGTNNYTKTNHGGKTNDGGTPFLTPPVEEEKTPTPKNPHGFKPLSLLPQYRDEENKIGWRASYTEESKAKLNSSDPLVRQAQEKIRDSNETVTNYLGPEERKKFAVQSKDGLLENSQNQNVSTRGGGGGFSGSSGTHIFALGLDGGLHMGDAMPNNDMAFKNFVNKGKSSEERLERGKEAQQKGLQNKTFHHSSFYAGGDIAGAGEIGVSQGRVQFIGDGSGHYRPDGRVMHQTVSHMGKSKEDGGLGLSLMDPSNNKQAVVGLMGKNRGEDDIKMPVSSFLQTGGNEKQLRNKIGLQGELNDLKGPQMEFNPGPGSGKRVDGFSPNDHVSDYEKVDNPREQNHVDSTSVLSPALIKRKITQDRIRAAKYVEGDKEAMKANEEERPAFLRNLDKRFGSKHQNRLQERLTPLPEAPYLGKVLQHNPSKTPSLGTSTGSPLIQSGEGNTNYGLSDYGSKTNYLSTNYDSKTNSPGTTSSPVEGDTPVTTSPVGEEKTTNYFSSERNYPSENETPVEKETKPTNYLSERNYPGGSHGSQEQGSVSEPQEQETKATNYFSSERNYPSENEAPVGEEKTTNYLTERNHPSDDHESQEQEAKTNYFDNVDD
jgi:hypothetical protein